MSAPGRLVPPTTPKLTDVQAERVRREHETKISELQQQPGVSLKIIANISLPNGTPTLVAHGLGRAPLWAGPSCIRADAPLSSTQGIIEFHPSAQTSAYASYDITKYVNIEARGFSSDPVTIDLAVM